MVDQRSDPLNTNDLLRITILVPVRIEYQRGIHATSDMGSKVNVALNPYHHRILDKACTLLGVGKRTFMRQVAIRAAAEVIGYYENTPPPPVEFEKKS